MKDPIFKHLKVHDWGGGKPSGLGPEPYIKMRARYSLLESIFCKDGFMEHCKQIIKTDAVVIYAMAVVGRALVSVLKDEYTIPFCIDKAMQGQHYMGIPIYSAGNLEGVSRNATVIVSMDHNEEAVINLMKKEGFKSVISIKD